MQKISEVLNKHLNLRAGATEEELDALLKSKVDNLKRLFSKLEQPEFAEYIKFAIEWQKLEYELRALQCKLHERLAKKPINPIDEFLNKLRRKN